MEGCTVNKGVLGHPGGYWESCVLVPGCHANPLGLSYTDPELDKWIKDKDGWMDGWMSDKIKRGRKSYRRFG